MSLMALLDDIAVLAKTAAASVDDVAAAAARASAKAAAVVVDDTAVTPQYLNGADPKRELHIVRKIAVGSLRNKLVFILPALLLLSWLAPWTLTPLLMLGGAYLCYEGAHKIWSKITGQTHDEPAQARGPEAEKQVISGAIRTDFILSAEIMVIAMAELEAENVWLRAAALVVVALVITAVVYGLVALIVKMDDIGLHIASQPDASPAARSFGQGLVKAMPVVLNIITVVGVLAMLWVGGHLILTGMNDLGFHPPYEFVHHLEEAVGGGALGWLVNTFFSLLLGLLLGLVIVALVGLLPHRSHHEATDGTVPAPTVADEPQVERSGGATAAGQDATDR